MTANEMAGKLRLFSESKDKWRRKAYIVAASKLEAGEVNLDDPESTHGIGKSIADKIREMVANGTFKEFEKFTKGKKLATNVKMKKSANIERRPLCKALAAVKPVIDKLQPIVEKIEVCGSIRRRNGLVADADILVVANDHETVAATFRQLGDVQVEGDSKLTIVRDGFQIDLNFSPADEWGTQLLHHTGSKEFNIMCRGKAKKRSWKMSQHDIGGEKFETEEAALAKIEMDWIAPEKRGNQVPDPMEDEFKFDPNSTKNEGRWRLKDPDIFSGYWREKTKDGIGLVKGTNMITNKSDIQALRFNLNDWTEKQAATWWKKHKMEYERTWQWPKA